MQRNLLFAIIIFAFLIRIIALGTIPQGFNPDEASQGYTAYSILKTGHDEWGLLPSITGFKSFLDYKAPLQTYLMIPTIYLFGLNEFAVRLPSAIFGTLAVLALALLSTQLFPQLDLKIKNKYYLSLSTITAFILAISPWHIQFSRTALEANLISFFFPFGLYCFLKAFKNPKWLPISVVSWSLAVYSYHAAKFFVPLFIICAFLVYKKELLKLKRNYLVTSIIILFIFALPLGLATIFGDSGKRSSDLLITKLNTDQIKDVAITRYFSPLNKVSPLVSRVFHNRLTYSIDKFFENYVSYYTPSFWFTEGGRETTYSIIPGRGLLFLWELPFIVFGLFSLYKSTTFSKKHVYLITAWLFLAALPAALTQEGYRPNRASAFLGFWELIAALGIVYILSRYSKKIFSISLLSIIIVVSLISYTDEYSLISLIHQPRTLSYGWRETVHFSNTITNQYDHVYVERGNESHMMIAFYQPILPQEYQQASQNWDKRIVNDQSLKYLDQIPEYDLGKYTFKHFNWNDKYDKEGLYISYTLDQLPNNRHTLHITKSYTGEPLMEVFDFRNEGKFAQTQ